MTYPSGSYRRRIRITSTPAAPRTHGVPQTSTVTAELEDDFHHFRVTVAHDGRRVTAKCFGWGDTFPALVGPWYFLACLPLHVACGVCTTALERHNMVDHITRARTRGSAVRGARVRLLKLVFRGGAPRNTALVVT